MERPKNLYESLKGIIDTARYLFTLTGNDDQKVPAFWVRTTEEFSKTLTKKIVKEYNNPDHPNNQKYSDKITPEDLRFLKIKQQFLDIFEAEEDSLSNDFMMFVDGKSKINNDWIKINRDIQEFGFGVEDEKLEQSIRENSGYRITAVSFTKEERKNGKVDVELPLSNIFAAAQWVDNRRKGMSPRFPYLFFFYLYYCFLYSVPSDRLPPSIHNAIEEMYSRKEKLLEKPKNKTELISDDIKDKIAPLINSHKDGFSNFYDKIINEKPKMDDDNLDKVVMECDKAINIFTENGKMSLPELISKLMNSDADKIRETMDKFALSENNIKNIIDGATGGMSNDELKNSIPTVDGIDLDKLLG